MRWISLLVGIVFVVAGIKALVAYDPTTATLSQPVLLLVAALGASIFLFLFARASRSASEVSEFEQWLDANAAKIMAGGATYNGQKVTPETEVKRFLLTISVIFSNFKNPSSYFFDKRD